MKRALPAALAAAALAIAAWLGGTAGAAGMDPAKARPAPEFTHTGAGDWINSPPLTLEGLRGRVVMLDIWAFGCWNCYRSFPWLKGVEARHGPGGLQVIGVHTPEFEHEKVRASIEGKVAEFDLEHPVMIDNDFSYWRALGNRYWPTFYLIDRRGRLRARFIGETHDGTDQARRIDQAIEALLAEAP